MQANVSNASKCTKVSKYKHKQKQANVSKCKQTHAIASKCKQLQSNAS